MDMIIFLVVVLQNHELESLKIVYFMIKILFFEPNNIQRVTLFKIH